MKKNYELIHRFYTVSRKLSIYGICTYGCIHLDQTGSIQEHTDHNDVQSHEAYIDTVLPLADTQSCRNHIDRIHKLKEEKN